LVLVEQALHQGQAIYDQASIKWLMATLVTGGEVEKDALFEFACVHSEREN
jgi:hypothetical protein